MLRVRNCDFVFSAVMQKNDTFSNNLVTMVARDNEH